MQDKKNSGQNKPDKMAQGEQVYAGVPGKEDPCNELLDQIRNRTIPVSIHPTQVIGDSDNPQYREISAISRFIKESRIDFNCYKKAMDNILNAMIRRSDFKVPSPIPSRSDLKTLCDVDDVDGSEGTQFTNEMVDTNSNVFNGGPLLRNSKSYNILKYATERYVYTFFGLYENDLEPTIAPNEVLPYVKLVEANIGDVCCKCETGFRPVFAELIWNYWMEEGMVVNTINAIANRFQNKRTQGGALGNLAIDPLRPLNNLLWGYIQDKSNHLTLMQRTGEYAQQYGFPLFAAGRLTRNNADRRTFFVQAFHNLLQKCSLFYIEADNLLKVPDAFPVLNALREVHLILSEGANNQFGDLPVTARIEMLLEQYIISRPEIREFLGGRVMVPYEEAWMDRVDSMKLLQRWPGTSVSYFRDLAVFGEQIILSIRWISWSQIKNRDFAREWAITFREDVQRYIHCYQAVTGVDLSASDFGGGPDLKAVIPAFLLKRKAETYLIPRR